MMSPSELYQYYLNNPYNQNQQANLGQRFLNIGQDPRYKVAFPNG